jgi:hypothetical protein
MFIVTFSTKPILLYPARLDRTVTKLQTLYHCSFRYRCSSSFQLFHLIRQLSVEVVLWSLTGELTRQ